MKVLDKEFEVMMTQEEIDSLVSDLASKLDTEYQGKDLVIVAILNGSFIFVSDLVRKMKLDPEVIFLKYKSYKGTRSGEVKVQLELEDDIEDKHVLILEDIVDTGKTIVRISQDLKEHEPASLKYGTLFLKPDCYNSEVELSFIGKELPNKFVLGYGMDYNGKGRSLNELYQLKD
ncbi:hypoxanthine phosphoribosyltransferase [Reichenbachiella versicolor]|uniref:hypoxanthine phosphoribosyltransferase n=1 Tax=Reichenbachiella versicolor TaxID=1821036 RepID=UPI000D6DCA30|nr:hypoxanthine phosphoribosyltransferase [Reichenbachiella versicolor]